MVGHGHLFAGGAEVSLDEEEVGGWCTGFTEVEATVLFLPPKDSKVGRKHVVGGRGRHLRGELGE